jgi:Fe-S cluster assembly scaffold protein SufB
MSGVRLRVPAGGRREGAVKLRLGGKKIRSSISLGKNSVAKFLIDYSGNSGECETIVSLGKGARLEMTEIKAMKGAATFITKVACGEGASFSGSVSLLGGKIREKKEIALSGKGADAEISEILCAGKGDSFAQETILNHSARETKARAVSRTIVANGGSAVCRGLVKISKAAQKTDSFLSSGALLLDSASKCALLPSLEIEADDVKAGHSASSAPIDSEKVFYLTSKGIGEKAARKMIALGFLSAPDGMKIEEKLERMTNEH